MAGKVLLILPCNPCVRLGDYSLCDNWRMVVRYLWDLVLAGKVVLAAVDSCKPGIVERGSERELVWCDRRPYWGRLYDGDSVTLDILTRAVTEDMRWLKARYDMLVYYVNVRAYHKALLEASKTLGLRQGVDYLDLTPGYNPLRYRKRENLRKLRIVIEHPPSSMDTSIP